MFSNLRSKRRNLTILFVILIVSMACQSTAGLVEPESTAEFEETAMEENKENEPESYIEAGELPQPTPQPLTIQPVPQNIYREIFMVFEKYVNVFGVHIFADEKVSDEKLMHAAQVMAQYLDNNEDGYPDNQRVVNAMTGRDATLIMFERPETRDEEEFITRAEVLFEMGMAIQPLYANETIPNGASSGMFDATLEEVLHLITASGYANAYPDIWGEEPGTEVANAMDAARGGRFLSVPASYPAEAWYTYDDVTCEYNCMVTEYIYWSLTSLLGAQDFPSRYEQIRHEWRLNTPATFRTGDPVMFALLTDPEYKFPAILPDGIYTPQR